MKKRIFLFALFSFIAWQSYAQTRYNKGLQKVKDMGYTIAEEKEVDLSEGQTGYSYKTFYKGLTYMVFGVSEDDEVQDLDLYIYDRSDDELLKKDADESDVAVVNFTTNQEISGKVVIKNYKSDKPNRESTCRYLIAYKAE